MNNVTKGILIVLGVIVVLGLIAAAAVFGITQLIRQTAEQALAPVTQTNHALETRVAQMMDRTPTIIPDPVTVIQEVRSLARLQTIQYTLEKVITAQEGQNQLGFLFGDKLIFVGHGQVIAGVDLARMQPEDMRVEGQVLYVRMPPPEIFVVALDNEKSYVYNRDTGLLAKGDINLETTARQAAEKEILQAALEDGILNQARQNAESYLSRMLLSLGYQDVIFLQSSTPEALPTVTLRP